MATAAKKTAARKTAAKKTAAKKKVKKMKASDLFIRCLEAEGVERIFGIPGEENADLMISLMDSKI